MFKVGDRVQVKSGAYLYRGVIVRLDGEYACLNLDERGRDEVTLERFSLNNILFPSHKITLLRSKKGFGKWISKR
jgi:uncharacterized protein YodC (DUF2158 family)